MFRKLRLFYYNNKQIIWVSLGIIVLVYVIIRIINYNIKIDNERQLVEQISQDNNTSQSNTAYLPSNSNPVMSDSKVSSDTLESDSQIIQKFIDCGNSNDVEGTYNLISQECKDEMFSDIDVFYNNYFKDIFNQKRSYDIETWDTYGGNTTYRIKYLNDIMATGSINDEFIEDYFTVITENNEKKLNINQFIKKNEVNKTSNQEGLEISVLNQYVYYDYEQYEITFKNNNNQNITIDTKDNSETVYVTDSSGVKYSWFGNEVPNEYLTLAPGDSRTFRIKFNKMYNPDKRDYDINFGDVRINGENEATNLKIPL